MVCPVAGRRCRRPFGDGPSSRPVPRVPARPHARVAVPSGTALHRGFEWVPGGGIRIVGRRPFGDGPSSRPAEDTPNALKVISVAVPSGTALHRGDWNDTYAGEGQAAGRRPFGDGPSSRRARLRMGAARRRKSPSLRGRPFIEAASADMLFGEELRSPSLRGRPFIEARARRWPPGCRLRVAVPSGTALHRGGAHTGRWAGRGVQVAVPSGTALHRGGDA